MMEKIKTCNCIGFAILNANGSYREPILALRQPLHVMEIVMASNYRWKLK
jgi:hypothetical protein